jgi:hypothetical protein
LDGPPVLMPSFLPSFLFFLLSFFFFSSFHAALDCCCTVWGREEGVVVSRIPIQHQQQL